MTPNPRPADLVVPRFARPSVCILPPRLFGIGPALHVITMDAASTQLYEQLIGMSSRNGSASAKESPRRIAARTASTGADGATHDGLDETISDPTDPAQPLADRSESSTDGPFAAPPMAVSAPASSMPGINRTDDTTVEQHVPVDMVSLTPMRLCNPAYTALQMPSCHVVSNPIHFQMPGRSHDSCAALTAACKCVHVLELQSYRVDHVLLHGAG